MIAVDIDSGNSTDCAEDAAGGLIADIDSDVSINFSGKSISYDTADLLIATPNDADEFIATPSNSTDCADTNILDDTVDGFMMLMCWSLLQDCCYDNDVMILEKKLFVIGVCCLLIMLSV